MWPIPKFHPIHVILVFILAVGAWLCLWDLIDWITQNTTTAQAIFIGIVIVLLATYGLVKVPK